MVRTYYYAYQMPEKRDWLRQSMEKLSEYIARPPLEIAYKFEELPTEYESDVIRILDIEKLKAYEWQADLIDYFTRIQKQITNLFVLCPRGSHIERICKSNLPHAVWGCGMHSLAFVYVSHDEYILWHEMLHIFRAKDCYCIKNGDRGPTCELSNCIMQFEPLKDNVGDWPFLCEQNISRVKRTYARWTKGGMD